MQVGERHHERLDLSFFSVVTEFYGLQSPLNYLIVFVSMGVLLVIIFINNGQTLQLLGATTPSILQAGQIAYINIERLDLSFLPVVIDFSGL